MTEDTGLSVREAVQWCGSGTTVRGITRLLRLEGGHPGGRDGRRLQRPPGRRGDRHPGPAWTAAEPPIVGHVVGFALGWDGQERGMLWISGDTVVL